MTNLVILQGRIKSSGLSSLIYFNERKYEKFFNNIFMRGTRLVGIAVNVKHQEQKIC